MRILFFLLLLAATGCKYSGPVVPAHTFITRELPSPFDTTVYEIADYKGFIFCRQADGTIAIIDTAYVRQPALEKMVNKKSITQLLAQGDSLFLTAGKEMYYLSDSFQLTEYLPGRIRYVNFYEDSTFRVSECCAGEFGGSVFFLEKATNKMYSYPATCAAQVLLTKSGYFITSNLAHLGYSTGYFSITDPRSMYELTADSQKNHCNWWVGDTSYAFTEKSDLKYVRYYHPADRYSMTALSFRRNDSLYAVVSGDSATCLTVLRDSAFVVKDTILHKRLNFHETQVIRSGNRYISLLRLTGGSPFAAYWVNGDASGLIVANGQNIDMIFGRKNKR